ncbi:glycerol-3-phosphate dehydrogenase [NAD(P)+] [Halolactibacillus alkaliphilus]|uniref:Glycerol-3-phosphate dehydrogenase [NAD(P)+] n=1 Tax=Halolactibacillus alkaliphilus TaxID=442899 RepID=A0A511X168_9BACI|nr:NAD(P)H-dependent glycerol-3-phosphate dehydrogenase [Halolactibacillus alkaliphilus]GEN56696.1 glycerol-3-phosphate dehydrogenase [NAD(P)+] [Halolactibacillus alkaliphilus]GGN70090.1 glycerol-3-phosphate dehydrogenase [NAD(P)+] [Halolactibacillus alkaliphilus]SFO77840.1 glycerol 3-phosphate dehydrogenase (NAD(P)+) [Halolactibacillus alkaliphilus]
MEKVAVLGAGSWGTALALVLHDNGHDVRLWTHLEAHAKEINATHHNHAYLNNVEIPSTITVTSNLETALADTTAVVFVLPTTAIRPVCQQVKAVLDHPVTIIHGTKGIEPETFKRVSEMMEEELSSDCFDEIVVLSGPSHAEEVSIKQPTTVSASSLSEKSASHAQQLFMNERFRVYTNKDVLGVELGGSLKNIIALGAGISDGLGYGDNAKAALVTRGLAEIARLGTAMGADPLTFIGLTGIGDLIVTSTSQHSRNWRAGNLLAKGGSLDSILTEMGMVVEGVRTAKAAYHLAKEKGIDMPITSGIYHILFEGADPQAMVDQLMTRQRRPETDEVHEMLKSYYLKQK